MFEKLKNKFTVIQVITIGIVIIVSFSMIYFITNGETNRRIDGSFESIEAALNTNGITPNHVEPRPRLEVYIIVFKEFEEVTYQSNSNLEESDIELILLEGSDKIIDYKDNIWEMRTVTIKDNDVYVYLNITDQQNILSTLRNTLLLIGISFLVIMAIISRIFSKKAIHPIEKSYEMQKTFVSDASHELRTPLAIMNSNLDLFLNYPDKSDEEIMKWLLLMKDEVKNMTNLSNNLLFLSSNKRVDYEEINISDLLKTRLLMYDPILYENKITLEEEIEDGIFINGISTQLHQLFINLIDNAIAYSLDARILMKLYKKGNKMIFKISNKTNQETVQEKGYLFDRFYQVDKSRTKDGKKNHGLGLSIVKCIVHNHNGKISTHTEGEFITFRISINLVNSVTSKEI